MKNSRCVQLGCWRCQETNWLQIPKQPAWGRRPAVFWRNLQFTVEYFNIFFLFPCILWSTIFQLCGSLCLLLLGLKSFCLIFKAKSPHQTGWETRLLVDKHFWLYSFPLYSFVLWCGQTWLIVFCSVVQFCGQTWLIVLSITRHKAFVNRTENKGTITVQRYMLEQQ